MTRWLRLHNSRVPVDIYVNESHISEIRSEPGFTQIVCTTGTYFTTADIGHVLASIGTGNEVGIENY